MPLLMFQVPGLTFQVGLRDLLNSFELQEPATRNLRPETLRKFRRLKTQFFYRVPENSIEIDYLVIFHFYAFLFQ